MKILKTISFGVALSFLHYCASFIFLFEVIFAHWDTSERPLRAGEAIRAGSTNALWRVFSFPVLLIGEWFYKGIPPDGVYYVLAELNSYLWGFSIMLLWIYRGQLFAKSKLSKPRGATA